MPVIGEFIMVLVVSMDMVVHPSGDGLRSVAGLVVEALVVFCTGLRESEYTLESNTDECYFQK